MKNIILPIIHNMKECKVYGMNAGGDKYTAVTVPYKVWGKVPEYQKMLEHCWKGESTADTSSAPSVVYHEEGKVIVIDDSE